MDFKVFLSDEALSDLERIVAYIAPRNPGAVGRGVQSRKSYGRERRLRLLFAL